MNDLSTALGRVRNSLASNLGADGVLVLTKGDVAEVLALINQPANPQGEQVAHMPVERCYDVRAKMIIAFNESKKAGGDLDDALDAAYKSALRYSPNPLSAEQHAPFQSRVKPWMLECFGETIAADRQERNHRFLEEALELVQANQCNASEAHQLVDYVYGRPVGDPAQEAGGVMVTLAALCLASGLDMHAEGETELARIWTKVEQIRAKQAAKPAMSPLPGAYPDREQPAPVAVVPDGYCIMPRQLTAENGAKALLLGEFKLLVTKECPECCELEEPTEGCSICDGEGEYGQKHTIPWDQLKYIYSKAVSGLAVKTESAKSR